MLKKKINIEQTDKKLMYMVGIFFIFLILGIWLSTYPWYQIIMTLYSLVTFIFYHYNCNFKYEEVKR